MRHFALFRKSNKADSPSSEEAKGYYEDRSNTRNEFLKQLFGLTSRVNTLQDWALTAEREKLFKLYADPNSGNSVVYAVVSSIAAAVADVMQYAELQDADNDVVEKHWSLDLLREPNDATTLSEFMQLYTVNLLVVGDAFVYGQSPISRLNGQRYSSMYVMPSHLVQIISGGVIAPIKGYRLTTSAVYDASAPLLTPSNVMFAKLPNPSGETFHGLSPLISALKKIELLDVGDRRMNSSFKNGGVVNVVFPKSSDGLGLTPQQTDDFNDAMNEGVGNKTKFVATEVGAVRLGDTPADLTILQTSEYATQAICNVYSYPLDLLYARSTYSNMSEAKKMRYQIAIPYAMAFLEKYGKWTGVVKEGLHFTINTDKIEVLKPNATEVIAAMVNAGTTINERREYLGYEPIKEDIGDQVTYAMSTAFAGDDAALSQPLPEVDDVSQLIQPQDDGQQDQPQPQE